MYTYTYTNEARKKFEQKNVLTYFPHQCTHYAPNEARAISFGIKKKTKKNQLPNFRIERNSTL